MQAYKTSGTINTQTKSKSNYVLTVGAVKIRRYKLLAELS